MQELNQLGVRSGFFHCAMAPYTVPISRGPGSGVQCTTTCLSSMSSYSITGWLRFRGIKCEKGQKCPEFRVFYK